jgi:branched-chain amino acid transport system substrate-binding protein
MKTRNNVGILVLACFLVFTFATISTAAEDNVIKLGAAISMTGKLAKEGTMTAKGFDLAVKRINEKGLLKLGEKTYRLETKVYDDEGNAHTCAKLVEKLITEDKIDYILGPYSTTITLPASTITEKYKRPMVVTGASSIKIFERGYKYVFGLWPDNEECAYSTVELFAKLENPAVKKIAVFAQNDIFAQAVAAGAKEKAKQIGLAVVSDISHPVDVTDLSTELKQIQASGAQAIIQVSHFNNAFLVRKQMKELNINLPLYECIGPNFPQFRADLGQAALYVYTQTQWHETMNVKGPVFGSANDYNEAVKAMFGHGSDDHTCVGSAAVLSFMYAFMDAFKDAGKVTPDTVRDALAKQDKPSFYGQLKYKANGIWTGYYACMQLQPDGNYVVYPDNMATRKPIHPPK